MMWSLRKRPDRRKDAFERKVNGLGAPDLEVVGGMKQSGIGREGGHEGLMEFLQTQYISTNW